MQTITQHTIIFWSLAIHKIVEIVLFLCYTTYAILFSAFEYNIGGIFMNKIVIDGPCKLQGIVKVSGAKNAALAIIPATLLVER